MAPARADGAGDLVAPARADGAGELMALLGERSRVGG